MIYDAVVEDNNDPMKLGRVRVRVFGLHTDNTALIPTEDLVWARVLMPGAAMSGIGQSISGLLPGSWVMVMFQDAEQQYPIVLGAYHSIPSKPNATTIANDDLSFAQVQVHPEPQASQGTYTPTDKSDVTLPSEVDPNDLTGMPITPPTGTPSYTTAAKNISIIISECKKAGYMTRRAISSILGIIGGESNWIPQKESFYYSAKRLVEVFPSVFPTLEDAKPYEYNSAILPEKLYGYDTKKGKMLGNTSPGDGSKYVGRGFIQLTGKANYVKYANLASVDIVNNPDLLNTDPVVSAKVACAYFLDRCKTSQLSEGYFESAKRSVGNNTSDIAIKKRSYYDYFMGGVDRSSSQNQVDQTDPAKFDITQANDPSIYSAKAGFSDPSGKYPLYINEQDTSRLARKENLDKTIVQKKNDNRVRGIESGSVTWDEQLSPYNTTYPFNKVIETESGHVIEIDDTPNAERLHVYHRTGSYVEFDNTGSRTTRIVGSSYEIIDCNGHIYIAGACNLTIGGNANINVGGNLLASVAGDSNINVGGDTNLAVGGDLASIAQNINLEAIGSMSLKAGGQIALDGATIHLNDGLSSPSGLTVPSMTANMESKANPVPTKTSDSKTVLFEAEGDSAAGELLIKEAVANGEISADEATKKPVDGESSDVNGINKSSIPASCASIASMDRYPDNLRLSPNFTLGQVSSRAAVSSATVRDQNGLHVEEIVCNLQNICLNVLEPVIQKYSNAFVTSGFRYPSDNSKSQHPNGEAVDIQFRGVTKAEYYEIAKYLAANLPVFDQLLLEYAVTSHSPWIHISCTRGSNRRQVMTFNNHKKYRDGLIDLS